jgi:hypothetical protein
MPSTSYVPTLLRTSSPTSGGPLAPKRLCFALSAYGQLKFFFLTLGVVMSFQVLEGLQDLHL